MNAENNIVLTIEEITTNTLEVEYIEPETKNKQIVQKTQNTTVFTKAEKQLDKRIRATINRNLLRQRQIMYVQAMQQRRQKRRRFGLKFK